MDKRDFFIKALKARKFTKLQWLISIMALIKQDPNAVQTGAVDYEVISDLTGYSFYNPETLKLEKITNTQVGVPLMDPDESIYITTDDIPNLTANVKTTYGILLYNWICLVNPFGKKISYLNKEIDPGEIEKIIVSKLTDIPDNPENRKDDLIYIDEYLSYSKSCYFLTGLSQVCTQGATKRTLTPPPGIKEFKQKLIEENKDSLDDMATVAKMDRALVEFDAQYLKGDPGEKFLISGKSRKTVRKKAFLMLGAEPGLDDSTVNAKLVTNSLNEGWDVSKLPDMNNSLRAGSFNRGAQTELGGVAVKWLLRASSNLMITTHDCGTKLGSPVLVKEDNLEMFVGFSIIVGGNSIPINTKEDAMRYVGRIVMLRNPQYCNLDKTDYCEVCVGKRLTTNPTGLSIAVSQYGSIFLSIFMSAAHSRELSLAHMDLDTAIL